MAKMGAPTKYSKELADKICRLVSTHAVGLETIVEEYDLPDRKTIYNWIHTYEEFFHSYMQAKEQQAHVLADEMLSVAKKVPVYYDEKGNMKIDNGILGRSKLQYDALRWSASILAPKFYGDAKNKETNTNDLDEECKKRYAEMDKKNRKEY